MAPENLSAGNQTPPPSSRRLVEYFAVCGLGLDKRLVERTGRFYTMEGTSSDTGGTSDRVFGKAASADEAAPAKGLAQPHQSPPLVGALESRSFSTSSTFGILHSRSQTIDTQIGLDFLNRLLSPREELAAATAEPKALPKVHSLGRQQSRLGRRRAGSLQQCAIENRRFVSTLVDRFPAVDHHSFKLPRMMPSAVLPYGVRLYSHGADPSVPESMPRMYPVLLTDAGGGNIYVAAVAFRDLVDPFLAHWHGMPEGTYADKCLCIVSRLPFSESFCSILEEIHYLCFRKEGCPRAVWAMIESLCLVCPAPAPSQRCRFVLPTRSFSFDLSRADSQLAEHASFLPLAEALDVETIIQLFFSLLAERKVLLLSANLKLLTLTCEALLALLCPLRWPDLLVPILPADAMECLDAPVPFLFGMCTHGVEPQLEGLSDLVVVNLDRSNLRLPLQDRGAVLQREMLQDAFGLGGQLRKSLCWLLKPHVSSMMALRHARPQEEQNSEELRVALEEPGWGPQHELRFRLLFLRFLEGLLGGYQDYLDVIPGVDGLPTIQDFRADDFVASRRDELSLPEEGFLRTVLDTQVWQNFVNNTSHGDPGQSLSAFSVALNMLLVLDAARPGSVSSVEDTEGSDLDEGGGSLPPGVGAATHSCFPESPACTLHCAREEQKARAAQMRDAHAEKEQKALRELRRLDFMSRLCRHLDEVLGGASGSEVESVLESLMGAVVQEEVDASVLLSGIQVRFQPKTDTVVSAGAFASLKKLLERAIGVFAARGDFVSAASLVEIAGRVVLEEEREGEGEGERVRVRPQLRSLQLWHELAFWEAFFDMQTEGLEVEGSVADMRQQVLLQLVRVMAELGLPDSEVSTMLEALAGGLSIRRQIMLRQQFAEMKVALHPQAKHVRAAIQALQSKRQMTPATAKWVKVVAKIKG